MTGSGSERGSASVAALLGLTLIALLGAASALLLRGLQSFEARSRERFEARGELERAAREVVAELARDPTPEADSPLDPVWAWVRLAREDGLQVELADLSSSLNPNWVQKNILTRTRMGQFLATGGGADELQQRREDQGFSTEIVTAYGDLFQEGMLERYFSGYGYANVNTTDEFALRKLYLLRTGDAEGAERFHARIQEALKGLRIFKEADLATLFGDAYARLYPVMNAKPSLNVHFVEPFVLSELLSYPEWKIRHPETVSRTLEERRRSSELTAQELKRIIGAAEEGRIHQYLGVTTWFWRVSVSRGAERLDCVVARLPASEEGPTELIMVEERYSR